MLDFVKKLYHKYSNAAIFRIAGKVYRNGFFVSNYISYLKVKKISKNMKNMKRSEKIKVAFVCQYVQIWNKLRTVYEKMINDDRYEVVILAVPESITNPNTDIYEYFKEMYGNENVIDSYKDGKWYELEKENPDYVFIQRPYDQYLPKIYMSGSIAKYAKVCFVDYGFLLTKTSKDICLSKAFFRNVYYFFAENSILKEFNIDRFKISHKKGYRKTVNIGYPVFEDFVKNGEKSIKESDGRYKILWTPRWTEDKQLGGSNFMRYKDRALEIPALNEKFYMIFRPHPMTFSHLVSINKMTEKEVNEYIDKYEKSPQMEYDTSKDYTSVFWNTDVMVTDISSILVEYFITGKPIIYCKTGAKPDKFFEEVLKVLYVVDTWEEVEEKLIELSNGIDTLKDAREKKIKELIGGEFKNISDRFLEEIYADYYL